MSEGRKMREMAMVSASIKPYVDDDHKVTDLVTVTFAISKLLPQHAQQILDDLRPLVRDVIINVVAKGGTVPHRIEGGE